MPHQHFTRNEFDTDTADTRSGVSEILIHHFLMQPNGFKHLRTVIALYGRDTHLGHDLDHALGGGLHEILASRLMIHIRQHVFADHAVNGFEGQIRIDRAGAIAHQQTEMMHFACFAGFHYQTHASTDARPDQVMMQTGHGKQRRNRRVITIHTAITENKDVDLVLFHHASGCFA